MNELSVAMGEYRTRRLIIGKLAGTEEYASQESASCGEQNQDERSIDRAQTAVVVRPVSNLSSRDPILNYAGEGVRWMTHL